MWIRHAIVAVVLVAGLVGGCAGDGGTATGVTEGPTHGAAGDAEALQLATAQVEAIGEAVQQWQSADTIAAAHQAAEKTRNLVAGSGSGQTGEAGLIPDASGYGGLALALPAACVERDVLGGSWDDPATRWEEFTRVLDEWTPVNNTMPRLASHPQRIVGWAMLTLESDDLDEAHEYAGHAHLHADVTADALATCES